MPEKPIVFMITPFQEECLAVYEELKKSFNEKYVSINAGDMDAVTTAQRNILKDIVEQLRDSIPESNEGVKQFIDGMRKCLGVERRLNGAINAVITQMEEYLSLTQIIYSTIERILIKGNTVLSKT